ncbi:MAG: cytochrome b5 domain-containing protein [Bacillota bacterium]|nr:cytochrome b5 domain-containing protein [Bacillota bacterium]
MKKYNGKNGNPAYIAIEGKVYDVTNAPRWNNGMHEGVEAGNDLTEQMKNSPHGLSKLESVKVVGVLK